MDRDITQGRLILTDDLDRRHVALKPEAVDAIYDFNRGYWKTRRMGAWKMELPDLTPEDVAKLIDGQVVTDTPYNMGERKKLREIYEATEDFSMLELGAANGTVFERLGAEDFRYVGFEMMPELVHNFKTKCLGGMLHNGDVEDFISFNTDRRFVLFYAHVSLLMVKPDLVRAALKKAAILCEQFLIYDFLDHPHHTLFDDETLIFDMDRPEKWFIHDWDGYIKEVGFEIVDKQIGGEPGLTNPEHDNQIYGCGYIHAVRG